MNSPDETNSISFEHLGQFWNQLKGTPLINVLLGLAILINLVWVFKAATNYHDQNDFAHYFASSQLYLSGQADLYETDLRPTYEALGWTEFREPIFSPTNPPALVKLFSIYARLPPRTAHWAWLATQVVALSLALGLVYTTVKSDLSVPAYGLIVTVFLFLPFVRTHLIYSQVQLQLLLLILLGFGFLSRGKGWLGCLLVVAAALIKLYPLALLPWFVWRSSNNIRGRLIAGALSVAALIAGVWVTDLSMWQQFIEVARPQISNWVSHSQCFTLCSFGEHIGAIVTGNHESRIYFQSGLGLSFLALVAFQLWVMLRRQPPERIGLAAELAIGILLMLFCGATCWWHYLVFLIFPFSIAAVYLKPTLTVRKTTACVVLLAGMLQLTSSTDFSSLPTLLVLFAPMFSMIALTIYLAYQAVKGR
ncbi:MAG: hypothetical protein ACI87E_002244 [Mariniblastus sp.]|jgi:hypothetical protein